MRRTRPGCSITAPLPRSFPNCRRRRRAGSATTPTSLTASKQRTLRTQSEENGKREEEGTNVTTVLPTAMSRDALVDQIYSQVRFFKEDKFVLKAALRQLQAEMREEIEPT